MGWHLLLKVLVGGSLAAPEQERVPDAALLRSFLGVTAIALSGVLSGPPFAATGTLHRPALLSLTGDIGVRRQVSVVKSTRDTSHDRHRRVGTWAAGECLSRGRDWNRDRLVAMSRMSGRLFLRCSQFPPKRNLTPRESSTAPQE